MSTPAATPAISSSTPILDRLTPMPAPLQAPPKRTNTVVVVLLAIILTTVVLIVLMIQVHAVSEFFYEPTQRISKFMDKAIENSFSSHLPGYLLVWSFVSPWVALLAAVAIHELGHMIVGLATGFRIISVRVGPVRVSPPLRFRFVWKSREPRPTGLTRIVPIYVHRLRIRALAVMSAGALANVIAGLLVVLFVSQTTLFSAFFVLFCVLAGPGNLIPFRARGILSDGKRIFTLLRNSREGERWFALQRLLADFQSGVDFERLSPEFIAVATSVEDHSFVTVAAHYIAYEAAFHKHDDPETARLLEVCLRQSGRVGPLMREAVVTDAAVFQARRRKNVDLAQQWLADLPETLHFPQHRLQAQAAILEGQGDIPAALKKLDEWEALDLELPPSQKEMSLRYLQRWRAELLKQLEPNPDNARSSPSVVNAGGVPQQ